MKTSPISFELLVEPLQGQAVHGYDLGNMTVTVGNERATSLGPTSRLAMMIYPSFVDLVLGVGSIVKGPKRAFLFGATDSSFQLSFFEQHGNLRVMQDKRLLGIASFADITEALERALHRLDAQGELKPDDPMQHDLALARAELHAMKEAVVRVVRSDER